MLDILEAANSPFLTNLFKILACLINKAMARPRLIPALLNIPAILVALNSPSFTKLCKLSELSKIVVRLTVD